MNCDTSIIKYLTPDDKHRGPRCFQILFLSLYKLLIRENRKIVDYDKMLLMLKNIAGKTMQIAEGGGSWSASEKMDLIKTTTALIEEGTVSRKPNDPMLNSYTTEIETLLGQSKTENAQYDFKQGFHNLIDGSRNEKILNKIFLTLSAMGNSEANAVEYVLIGISDNVDDSKRIERKYNIKAIKVKNFYITGVDGEAKLYYKSLDEYYASLKNYLENVPLNEYYKRQVGAAMKMVDYNGKSVIILKIISDNGPVSYGEKFYTRAEANNNPEPIGVNEYQAFLKRFQ